MMHFPPGFNWAGSDGVSRDESVEVGSQYILYFCTLSSFNVDFKIHDGRLGSGERDLLRP